MKKLLAKLIPAWLVNFKLKYDGENISAIEFVNWLQSHGWNIDIQVINKEIKDEA